MRCLIRIIFQPQNWPPNAKESGKSWDLRSFTIICIGPV